MTSLFSQVIYTDFVKFRKKVTAGTLAPEGQRLVLDFEGPKEKPNGPLLFGLKINNSENKPKTVWVKLNAEDLGEIHLKPAKTREYFLDLDQRHLWPDNRIELKGSRGRWKLLDLEIKNIYGYSTGLFTFVAIPKINKMYQSIPRLFLPAVGILLFLLGWISAVMIPKKSAISRFSLVFSSSAWLVLIGAAFLPAISQYRLLFSLKSSWLFLLWLYFGIIPSLSKSVYERGHAALAFGWRIMQAAVSQLRSRKKLLIAVFVPLAVFLFFLNIMHHTLSLFQGDYSRFVCFARDFVSSNPIFWNTSADLLFPNSDFENGTLENWTATGNDVLFQLTPKDALKYVPYRGAKPLVYQGRHMIKACNRARETQEFRAQGTLTSAPFVIKKNVIGFLNSGGSFMGEKDFARQSVTLSVNGKIVREERGKNEESMELRLWNVRRWVGKTAQIVITAEYSHVFHWPCLNVDWFHYYQEGRIDKIKKRLFTDKGGFDGQYYYFITNDPFLSRFKDNPIKYRGVVDEPAYRFGRIGFPLLIKTFSLDRPENYPKTMVWLVLVSYFIGAFFLLKIVQFFKHSPLWTFFYALIPGFQLSLYRALPEPIGLAFLLAGLYFYLKRKIPVASLLFAASILVRETTGFFIVAVVLYELFKKRSFKTASLLGASILPYLFWRIFLTLRFFPCYGWATFFSQPGDFGLPFSGFAALYKKVLAGDYFKDLALAALAYPILLVIIFLFTLYFFWKRIDSLSLGLFFFSLVSLLLNYTKIWEHVDNGVRTTSELFVFLILAFISQKERLKAVVRNLFLGFFVLVCLFNYFLLSLHEFFRAGFFLK